MLFLKNNLQPGARIYTEYANEVWNGSFFPYSENMNATIGEINAGNSNLNYDGNTNPDILAVR